MQETKNLVEEALIQMRNVEEVIAENAKGILASTMKEEISQLVKESLSEQETEDEVEMDTELDMVDMDDEVDNDEEEIGMDDMGMSDIGMDDMEMSDMEDEDTIDLSNASDEEILKIFKSMSEEDGIIVKKNGKDVHITDTDEDVEYIVKLDESEDMEFNEELDEEDTDLDAVLSALGLDEEMDNEMYEEDDEVVYEIEMSEQGMEDEEDDEEDDEDMNSEDYHLEEAKMTVKPKGVGMGNPKFKYGKTLPKKGFDEKKKEGPKAMGTGKAKFEFKEEVILATNSNSRPILVNSSDLSSNNVLAIWRTTPSPCFITSLLDAQAISISACQNSVRCRRVRDFSALNEGAIVYSLSRAGIAASA